MLIDSDVLIWMLRGHPAAARRLSLLRPWQLSVVAYVELAQGCRDKAELAVLKQGLARHQAEILPLTPAISQRAADLIDALALSQGLRLADALIAATALELQMPLLTANVRHFGAVPGLLLEAFVP
jgi:hypothetical protein